MPSSQHYKTLTLTQITMNDKLIYLREATDQDLRAELELRGYYTNNLWQVDDVMQNYGLSFTESQEVLDTAMTSEWVMSQIFDTLDEIIRMQTKK